MKWISHISSFIIVICGRVQKAIAFCKVVKSSINPTSIAQRVYKTLGLEVREWQESHIISFIYICVHVCTNYLHQRTGIWKVNSCIFPYINILFNSFSTSHIKQLSLSVNSWPWKNSWQNLIKKKIILFSVWLRPKVLKQVSRPWVETVLSVVSKFNNNLSGSTFKLTWTRSQRGV